jgi:hypothetical protein
MSFFGFSSKKEVAEKERLAREAEKQRVLQGQQSNLSNLAKGSQVPFTIQFFDVFDPRFENFAVPVAVSGMIVYAVDDIARFNSINKTQNMNDGVFQQKLKGQVTKYVKSVVTNAPMDNQIQVLQLERKIVEISELVQQYVTPKIESLFGVNVRSIDIIEIRVNHDSRGYRELKAITSDLERDSLQRRQEMSLGGQEEMQRMQLEHQRETMRIQREELQRASRLQTETNFLGAHQADLNAGVQTAQAQGRMFAPQMPDVPPMPGMGGMPPMPGAMPQVSYMVGVNGQQVGPCDWNQLQQLVQQGQLTHQSYVWKQGMPQWQMAGEVMELTPLFQGGAPQMPPMPGM